MYYIKINYTRTEAQVNKKVVAVRLITKAVQLKYIIYLINNFYINCNISTWEE